MEQDNSETHADTPLPATEARAPLAALRRFRTDDSGAVSVDWIVLSAIVILFSLGAVEAMKNASTTIAPIISESLNEAELDMSVIN